MCVRIRRFVPLILQFSLFLFGLIVFLSQAASAQHILPAPPAPKSGVYGPQSNTSVHKSLSPRVMQRSEQQKKRFAPIVPVPSAKFLPGIAMRYTLRILI
jgi:hypothetical protein